LESRRGESVNPRRRILLQLDTDPRPSSFDAIVAVDAGVDVLMPYGGIRPDNVRDLVEGAIFTRGLDALQSTAAFIGGSDVGLGEAVLAAARAAFFGPFSVSLMLDCGGANTTAAAAVIAVERWLRETEGATAGFAGREVTVLASTGPVGRRVARFLARTGARVRCASRSLGRAEDVASSVRAAVPGAAVSAHATSTAQELHVAVSGAELIFACGGRGAALLSLELRRRLESLRVVVDLNAVPPAGIEGVDVRDIKAQREGITAFGAIGVGGLKMKIHKAAIATLFDARDRVLDGEAFLEIGRRLA
jgi:hypothetical protein